MAVPVGTAVGYLTLDYTNFSKNLKTAVSEANQLSGKFADTVGSGLTTIGDQISSVGASLTTAITLPLAAAAGATIKFGAEFDKGMSNVKAVSGATSEEFQTMRDAAIDWGEKTVYTATEASDALYYMGLAGWDANESVEALGPVLNLAAAGNLELGRTSDIVTDAMTALQIEASGYTNGVQNAEHFTNALAATMANSNTDVDQLGDAFKYVAPLAGSAGMSVDDLSLALGLMANVGVKASQAGTGLRQALKSVISPTDKAAGYMEQYGVSLFDAEGNAKSMKQFMDELRETFGDLAVDVYDANGELKTAEQIMEEYGHSLPTTQQEKLNAIVQIFGTRALPGVLGIIEQSEEKYNQLADAINGSDRAFVKHGDDFMTYQEAVAQFGEELVNTSDEFEVLGYSTGMAQVQMDNLQGDWIKFTSALGTTQIEITDLVNGALRELVQKLTELVTWFNGLDDEQQKNILRWAAIIASIGPVLLIFGKVVSTIGHLFTAFNNLRKALTLVGTGFKMLTGLSPLLGTFRNMFTVLGPVQGILQTIRIAFMSLFSPVTLIVGVIALLVASFTHLMKTNEEFREKIMSIWDGIKAKFEDAGQRITEALNKIGFDFTSLREALAAAFDWLSNTLAPFFVGWFQTISNAIGGLLDIIVGLFEIVGGLFAGFRDGDWSMFIQGLKDFAGGLFNLLASPFVLVFNTITEYLKAFGTSWSEIWNTALELFVTIYIKINKIITAIEGFISNFLSTILTAVAYFVLVIINGITDLRNNIINIVTNFISNIITSVTAFVLEVTNAVTKFRNSIISIVTKFIANIIMSVANFISNIKIAVTNFLNNIKNASTKSKEEIAIIVTAFVLDVVKIVTNFINNIIKSIKSFISSIITAVNNFVSTITSAITELKNNILNIFSDTKDRFIEIGSNIINGIAEGIDNGWQWLKDKVSNLANSLFESAKSALGISSPSRVFRDGFGYWIPMGAAEGVEKSMPKAIDQIQSAFDNGLSQITGEVDLESSTDSMVYSVQDAIEEVTVWFETVEERLSDVADNIKSTLLDIMNVGESAVTPEGLIIHTGGKLSNNVRANDSNGDTQTSGETVNNYYYTFNSPRAIDEIEAARKLKETQRDLSEGF